MDLIRERFEHRYNTAATLSPARIHNMDGASKCLDAIVMQGPVTSDTVKSVITLRALNPDKFIIVSTWENSPEKLIDTLDCYCDKIVTSPIPETPGGQHRNYQKVSTHAGICAARKLGAEYVLKVRTDCCVTAQHVFLMYRHIASRLDNSACENLNCRGRIFVNQTYTKKYVPYHISDIVMLGYAEDLERYWNAPIDSRPLNITDSSWVNHPLETIGYNGYTPECYFARQYAESVGWKLLDTLDDYWRLVRDVFAVMDDSWFDLIWFKKTIPIQPLPMEELFSHAVWQSIYMGLAPNLALTSIDIKGARRRGAKTSIDAEAFVNAMRKSV